MSDELGQRQIPVRRFELRGDLPDDESGRRKTFSVVDLCHDIEHNRVFVFCCGETEDLFDGIYVASDGHKHKYVHLVLASNYIALCSDVGLDGAR